MIQIKCFEEDHESDLEDAVNEFLSELDEKDFIDVRYNCSHFKDDDQIYSFSALLIYRIND